VAGAVLAQHVDHVAEVLVVAAVVRAHGDTVRILLDRGADDVGHAAVVPEVDHLGAMGLQDPANDVDGRVVSVEQRRSADEAQGRRGLIALRQRRRSLARTSDGHGNPLATL